MDTQTNPQTNTPSDPDISPSASGAAGQPAALSEPTGFIPATLDELRKVVWPSRQQLFSESVAVILMVGLSAAAIAAVDRFFGWTSLQVFR